MLSNELFVTLPLDTEDIVLPAEAYPSQKKGDTGDEESTEKALLPADEHLDDVYKEVLKILPGSPHEGVCYLFITSSAFSALTLLVGRQEGHPACKKTECLGVGMVICLERCADLHTAQLMPLPLTVSCFSEIQIGFAFLVPAHPGSPGKKGR